MKIAFYVYPIAFQSPGGGEIVLLKTKEYLAKEGVDVKLFDPWTDKFSDFDILHTFGSVKDCLRVMEAAQAAGTKNFLSSICWYSWKAAWGTYPEWQRRMPSLARQFAKTFCPFMPSQRKKMFDCADVVSPSSRAEAGQLKRYFLVPEEKMAVIPHGVDAAFAEAKGDAFHEKFGIRDFILCAGRIEPRKNQLNVIRALRGIKQPLVFIGGTVPAYKNYYEECVREAGSNVHFLGEVPHQSKLLASAYAACNTFLLATWLETPGLAAMEAGLAGAKVVVTAEGATKEYFLNYVSYVRPDSMSDIRQKTLSAFERPRDPALRKHLQQNYSWTVVAKQTAEAYRRVLGK
ncbi:MAG: glycosyltransferase family 4 protein [Candidatus Omnitrophica bacterium]|nr:glycosyltransferase family 4 protein [Candidatus Omnitrophota bacterium]MDD5671051.1 glycosyltransferase family 4 protein [Candidatus Omnitrophota bacterium]